MTTEAVTQWLIADVWETIARIRPDAACISQGDTRLSWTDFDRHADGFAQRLLDLGLGRQAKVAFSVRNCPEFLIGVFGCLKAGLVPVNTNFRYTADESAQIWNAADVECVVFSASIAETVVQARRACPRVGFWFQVDDVGGVCAPWADPFPPPAAGRVRAPWGREPDDLILLYTGGTTGLPKGVMWRQDDVFAILNATAAVRYPAADGIEGVVRLQSDAQRDRPRFLACGPLIHGTAAFSAYGVLGAGGSIVLLQSAHFDAREVLDVIDGERVTHLSIIGEAHAQPLVEQLRTGSAQWSLASLRLITSAGTAVMPATRDALLRFCPDALYVDLLGSSEAPLLGRARSTRGSATPQATFEPGPNVRVVDDVGRTVAPGSHEVGTIVVRGRGPLGYYNDEDAAATLFRLIEGQRWVTSGDLATVNLDGSLHLLGRASSVINTGGEKVYAREVEERLLTHPAVADAVVIGLPHDVLGRMVVAAVRPAAGANPDPAELDRHLRTTLAGYKVPKQIHVLDSVGRGENGKVDQAALARRLSSLNIRRPG